MDENNTNNEEKVEKTTQENPTTNETNDVSTSYKPKDVVETSYEQSTSSGKNVEKKEKKLKQKKSAEPAKKKSTVKLAIIIILAVTVLVAVVTTIYYLFFATTTINLSEHLSIKYDGYDGYATATVDFKSSLKEEFDESSVYKKFKKKAEIEITSDNNGTLKNGDTLEVKVDISKSWLENNKIKLKDRTIEIKVSGVPEPRNVNLFEDLEYTVTGISPNLSLSVKNTSSDEFISTVYYSLSDSYGLANGDTVTITASYSEYDTQEMGVVVESDTFEYTIENQPYYAGKKEDISESVIETLNKEMTEGITKNVANGKTRIHFEYGDQYNPTTYYTEDLVAGEPVLVNMYLLVPNDGYYYSFDNYVYGVYKVTYTSTETGATFDWYFTTYAYDLAVNSEGKIHEDKYNYYHSNTLYFEGNTADNLYTKYIEQNNCTVIQVK